MSVAYAVVGPLVIVTDHTGARHHVYQGAVLQDVSADQVDHLLGLGLIAKVGTAASVIPREGAEDPDSFPVVPAPEPPAKVATHKVWVDYAVSAHKADRAEAEALTKTELQELYG